MVSEIAETSFMMMRDMKQTPPPSPRRHRMHTVQMSDTLASISVKYGVTISRLQAFNGFRPGDQLWARREIKIPLPDNAPEVSPLLPERETSRKGKGKKKPKQKAQPSGDETPEAGSSVCGDVDTVSTDDGAGAAATSHCPAPTPPTEDFTKLPEVTDKKSKDFLSNFDKSYLSSKAQVTGERTSPVKPVVQNKQCLDFLSKFDKSYSAVKAETRKALGVDLHANKTTLESASRRDSGGSEADLLLARGAMKTYEGKLQAEDRALDAIQRILTSDFDMVADEGPKEERKVDENHLERDLDMFDL
eukprot:m.99350 g.99350  ORF g.99350 m.99350 type:complete len:304 (+) comp10305_c0_seq1:986-1897(+)